MMHWSVLTRVCAVALTGCVLLAALSSCGLGDGSNTAASETALRATKVPGDGALTSGFGGDLDWRVAADAESTGPGAAGDGQGGVAIAPGPGIFRRALVTVRLPDNQLLGSALTDENGLVTMRPGRTYAGPLLVEVQGQPDAVYYDPGREAWLPFATGQALRAYVSAVRGNVGVSAFTEAAYRLMREGDTAERVNGFPSAAQIESAHRKVREIVNGWSPGALQLAELTQLPVLLHPAATPDTLGTDERSVQSLSAAALAKQAATFHSAELSPALAVAQQLSEDLLDGRLDGLRSGQPIATADARLYDPALMPGATLAALAQLVARYGKNSAIEALPAYSSHGHARYEGYRFDARLTPAGQASVSVAGWDGANDRARRIGESLALLPQAQRVHSIHGNFGHGALFVRLEAEDSRGRLLTVGENGNGELGMGSRTATSWPQELTLPANATHLAGGFAHTVARLADGSVYAWGDNSYGQLGQGIASPQLVRSTLPLRVVLPRGAIAVAASNVASYALLEDGTVYSWGSSWGQNLLGDGSRAGVRLSPGPVLSDIGYLSGVIQIAARDNDAIALRADGSVLTWGSFPADADSGFTGGRLVASRVEGLPDPVSQRPLRVMTEQGLFLVQTASGAVYHFGIHHDLTAQATLRDLVPAQVLNLPPVRDLQPGGYLGYAERPMDRATAMGMDRLGGFWKIRGRVAERHDPAQPDAQRRPMGQAARSDCSSCHGILSNWPVMAPAPTSNAACALPPFKLDGNGQPQLVNSRSDCAICHNGSFLPFLNCVTPTLPSPPAPSAPPSYSAACQKPLNHLPVPSGSTCAACHNAVIARALTCVPTEASGDALAMRASVSSVLDDQTPVTGAVSPGGYTNDTTPTIVGNLSASLAADQTVQVLRNGSVAGVATVAGTGWTFTDSVRAQGVHSYSARVTQGVSSGPSGAAHTIVIDTAAPTPSITAMSIVDDAGAITGPVADSGTSDDATPSVQGTLNSPLAPGDMVRILRNNVDIGMANVSGTAFGYASHTLSNGTYTIAARLVDAAGNVGATLSRTFTVNTSNALDDRAFARITEASDNVGAVQGPVLHGGSTDDTQPTIRGNLGRALNSMNGEQLRIYQAGSSGFGVATVGNTSWNWTPPAALADGSYSFTAQVVDAQGRSGAVSTGFTLVVDRQAPVAIPTLGASSNVAPFAGTVLGTTNDRTPTIGVNLSAPRGSGEQFVVTRSVNRSAALTLSVTPTEHGPTSFSFVDTLSSTFMTAVAPPSPAAGPFTSPTLPAVFTALSVTYTVRLVDSAGNSGSAGTLSLTLDYPNCNRNRVSPSSAYYATHQLLVAGLPPSITTCASCHRAGSGFVQAPGAPSLPTYWCRY